MRRRLETWVVALLVGVVVAAALVDRLTGGHSQAAPPPSTKPVVVLDHTTLPPLKSGPIESGGMIYYWPHIGGSDTASGIYAVSAKGRRRDVPVMRGEVCCASWSPAGRVLVWVGAGHGAGFDKLWPIARTAKTIPGKGLFLPGGKTSNRIGRISAAGLDLGPGVWTPDGKRIVVWASGRAAGIYVITAAGAEGNRLYRQGGAGVSPRRITRASRGVQQPLAVSPDGASLLYFQLPVTHAAAGKGTLWVVPLAGGRPVRISPPGMVSMCCYFGSPASWSPDSSQVSFAAFSRGHANTTGESAVFVAAATGGQRIRITDWGEWTTSAHWSPNGQWIAFDRVNHGTHGLHDLFIVHPNGESQRMVPSNTQTSGTCCSVWSPNSKVLLYDGGPAGGGLWASNIDGSGTHRLSRVKGNLGYTWTGS
jgi:hypothetical protein